MQKIHKTFKALGEPTRLKIVKMLSLQSMCVCELSEYLGMLQPRISQHLRILKEAGIVSENREGYWIYYSLDKKALTSLWQEFNAFLAAQLLDLPEFEEVNKRINNSSCRQKINETKEKLKSEKK